MTKSKRCESYGRPGIRGGLLSKSGLKKRCQLRRGEFIRTCWLHGTHHQSSGRRGIAPPGNLANASSTRCCDGSRGYSAEEAIDLVKDAFVGRKSILVQDLHRLGRRYGFNKRIIQNIARTFGYKKKRLSSNRFHPWSYMNPNKEWRNFPIISDDKFADLRPPEEREPKPIVADFNVDDDDEDLRPSNGLPSRNFSDLD